MVEMMKKSKSCQVAGNNNSNQPNSPKTNATSHAKSSSREGNRNKSAKEAYCYLFGYGSLICSKSRRLTCPELKDRVAIPVVIDGLERSWNKRSKSGMTAMGVRLRAKAQCAGVLIPLFAEKELARFDRRERGYKRVKVDPKKVGKIPFLKKQSKHDNFFQKQLHAPGTQIWVYVPEKHRPPTKDHPIAQSYVDTILRGCLATGGEELCAEFLENTTGWNPIEEEQEQSGSYSNLKTLNEEKEQEQQPQVIASDDDEEEEEEEEDDDDDEEEEEDDEEEVEEEEFVWINDRCNPVYSRGDPHYSRENARKIDRLIRRYRPEYSFLRGDSFDPFSAIFQQTKLLLCRQRLLLPAAFFFLVLLIGWEHGWLTVAQQQNQHQQQCEQYPASAMV